MHKDPPTSVPEVLELQEWPTQQVPNFSFMRIQVIQDQGPSLFQYELILTNLSDDSPIFKEMIVWFRI